MLVTHWLTHWLTHSCLVNLIDVTLACEDANSKLVDVVTVADDDRVGRFGNWGLVKKLNFCLDWAQGLVKILKLKLRQDLKQEFGQFFLLIFCRGYEVESWSRFWSKVWSIFWSLSLVERLMFGWEFEVDAWSTFWRWNFKIKICVWTWDTN